MEYTKPEMVLLGSATQLIEGEKAGSPDVGNGIGPTDSEMED
jgi:hypothetical protein